MRAWLLAPAAMAAVALHPAAPVVGQTTVDLTPFLGYGMEVAAEIDATLGVSGTALYAEGANLSGNQFGGSGGRAFVWPLSAQFRVLNSLAQYDPVTYEPKLREFSDQLHAGYWNSSLRGYSCCLGGSDRYYDDNAHLAVALAEAYEITGDSMYLYRARLTYQFLIQGEAPGYPGGSYWQVGNETFLDSAAALQGARAGAMLYKATGFQIYLDNALQRYAWAASTTQLADGTFMEKLFLTGDQAGEIGNYPLVNFTAMGIEANLQFYDVTGDPQYLTEAQRIGRTAANKYFSSSTGAINDEGYWAYELVDAFIDLYEHDGRGLWLSRIENGLNWLHDNKEDPEGHYGRMWGRDPPPEETWIDGTLQSWYLNDQASVARAYLYAALLQTEPISGQNGADFNDDGVVNGGDFLVWQRGLGKIAQTDGAHGDANGDGTVDRRDLAIWQSAYATTASAVAGASRVPEPSSVVLVTLALCAAGSTRRQRS